MTLQNTVRMALWKNFFAIFLPPVVPFTNYNFAKLFLAKITICLHNCIDNVFSLIFSILISNLLFFALILVIPRINSRSCCFELALSKPHFLFWKYCFYISKYQNSTQLETHYRAWHSSTHNPADHDSHIIVKLCAIPGLLLYKKARWLCKSLRRTFRLCYFKIATWLGIGFLFGVKFLQTT